MACTAPQCVSVSGLFCFLFTFWGAVALVSPVSAQSPVSESDLQAQLVYMQQQIDDLKAMTSVPCCETPSKKPTFPNARLTGFFQADAVWFDQDAANRNAIVNGAPIGDIQDGADFRRARLAATGRVWDNIAYMLEMDFAFPGRPTFMDVWLDVDDVIRRNHLRIGQFRQPFGMDGLTSVKELTFLERGLPFAFLPFRQIGAMLHGHGQEEQVTWAISGFRFPTDTFGGNVGDDGGYGLATRCTGLLVNYGEGQGLVHVGGGYSFIDPANGVVRYRNQPEVFVSETGGGVPVGVPSNVPAFVDTGLIAADNTSLFNAELAIGYGSFYAQSEVIYAMVNQNGGPTLVLPGAYVHAGYFLTGESRAYNGKAGVFGRVIPRHNVGRGCGLGAWEIAGRWSHLDLNDENIRGGRLNNLTGGLNWYLNPHTKFQWNYIHSMLDNAASGSSTADVFAMRAQIDF